MLTSSPSRLIALAALLSSIACGPDSRDVPSAAGVGMNAHAFFPDRSPWSEPVNLGAPVNTDAIDFNPTLSPDERSLYFASNRTGGLGGIDIWVAQRVCVDCPWQAPVNLGPVINSAAGDNGPSLSVDGHLLFFSSNRPGGQGGNDIYVSRRADPNDDFAWAAPTSLGPDVNTPGAEAGPDYLTSVEDGSADLYFNRLPMGGTTDIYRVPVTRDGETSGPAELVAELSILGANDQAPTVRTDGREILFFSDRAGTLGLNDLWVSTRRSIHDAWSPPMNLGAPMNTVANDQQPSLASNARTLVFVSTRPGGLGGFDIWMSTRTPSGQ